MNKPQMNPIKTTLKPKLKELGDGFTVRRALPMITERSVGPWVFFDHFGPVDYNPGQGMDVRPHPHIGLATVTYLFEGEIFHRDSLGNALPILPGAINLMVAGRGIVHSERTRDELRAQGFKLHGLQLWHALPEEEEEREPSFHHYPAGDIPEAKLPGGGQVRVMMGEAFGLISPVRTFSQTLYYEIDLPAGTSVSLPDAPERAIYMAGGHIQIGDQTCEQYTLTVLNPGEHLITTKDHARFAVIGGEPLGDRHIRWNFVSSSKDRIERAEQDWRNGKFPKVPGDEDDFIPLP